MPTYHFNVRDGTSIPDADGHDFPDLESAKTAAVGYAGDLIREIGSEFWSSEEWVMEVTDGRGLILFTLTFMGSLSPAVRKPDQR